MYVSTLLACALWMIVTLTPLIGVHGDDSQAEPATEISWAVTNWPPFDAINGVEQGYAQSRLRQALIKALPQYQHSLIAMNRLGAESEAREGTKLCMNSSLNVAYRHDFFAYSRPEIVFLPRYLVARADLAASLQLPEPTHIRDLDTVLDGRTLALITGFYYHPEVDALRARMPDSISDIPHGSDPVRLVQAGRGDFAMVYPSQVEMFRRQPGDGPEPALYPLADFGNSRTTYVTCTKGPWGEAVLADINAAIDTLSETPLWRDIHLDWIPRSLHNDYLEAYVREVKGPRMRATRPATPSSLNQGAPSDD